jgi:hypothetical protein
LIRRTEGITFGILSEHDLGESVSVWAYSKMYRKILQFFITFKTSMSEVLLDSFVFPALALAVEQCERG